MFCHQWVVLVMVLFLSLRDGGMLAENRPDQLGVLLQFLICGLNRGDQDDLLVRPQGDVQRARAGRADCARGRADPAGRQFTVHQPVPSALEERRAWPVQRPAYGGLMPLHLPAMGTASQGRGLSGNPKSHDRLRPYGAMAFRHCRRVFGLPPKPSRTAQDVKIATGIFLKAVDLRRTLCYTVYRKRFLFCAICVVEGGSPCWK